jgi:hypothetical protein
VRIGRPNFRNLSGRLLLVVLVSTLIPVSAAASGRHAVATVGASAPTMMIKANDLAELPAGLGSWQIVGCGITALKGWTSPPVGGEPATGPCAPGEDRIFTSYASFKEAVAAHTIAPGSTAIFDPETWLYTPKYEVAHPVKYETLAGSLARANGISLIFTPQGPPRPLLDAQYRAIASFASVIEIQSQYQQDNPALFKREVEHDLAIIRAINPHVAVLAGVATDPGGKPASVSDMVASYEGVASLVQGFQLNVARWRAPRGTGCAPEGCARRGVQFLDAIGVS